MATEAEKDSVKDAVENDMMKKLKELFGEHPSEETQEQEPEPEPQPPLEAAIERALYSLSEIAIYGSYGRSDECAREAQEAYDIVKALKDKYDEQNKIMDVLSGKVPMPDGEFPDNVDEEE